MLIKLDFLGNSDFYMKATATDLLLITSHLDTVVQTQTNGRGSSLDRVVVVVAGVHHQLTLDSSHPELLVLRKQFVASNHQSVHVADAAPGTQDAVPVPEPDDLPHLLQHLVLHQDEDRGDLVGKHVGVGGSSEPLSSKRCHIQTTRQLVEEARVT